MPAILREKELPTYSLAESSSLGSSLFEIVELTGEVKRRKVDFLIPHRKDYYMIVLVKKGSSRHWIDGVPYTLKNNTLYFATPQQIHVKERSEPLQGMIVSFTEEFFRMEETHLLPSLPVILNQDNRHELILKPEEVVFVEELLKKMQGEFQTDHGWRQGMLLAYLRVLLIYISRVYEVQYENSISIHRALLRQFRHHIDRHFTNFHQVADYARLLAMTPGHLNDLVKVQSGKTAIEHIHERILLEAKRHLLHTDWSMKEIAFALGFEDAAYFGRFFKRLCQETPAAYRKAIREMYH